MTTGKEAPSEDFPILEMLYCDGKRSYCHLHSNYGFTLEWDYEKSEARFFFYDKKRNSISVTDHLTTFLTWLSTIPDGTELAWIQCCGAPFHYKMPEKMLTEIEEVLKKKKFEMAGIEENNFVRCKCQAKKVELLTELPLKYKKLNP